MSPSNRPEDFREGNEYLRERYGISLGLHKQWIAPAIFLALLGGGWLLWSANFYAQPAVRSTLVSFTALDATKVSVRYSLEFKKSGIAHTCRLVAHDYGTNVVGEFVDQIPAGLSHTTRTVIIPTRLLAVSAGIENCS
jgi:hypothetical protein